MYFALLAAWYAAATPIFEAPDEGAHFLYIDNLLKSGQLPVLEDRGTVFASRSVQRHHPPLYYLIGAALVAWTDRGDVDHFFQDNPFGAIGFVSENNQNIYLHSPPTSASPRGQTALAVWILRLYSLTLATGTVWLIYKAGQIAFPGRPVGLPAMIFAISIPGFLAGAGSINNDNLVTLLFAAGAYLCLRAWRRGQLTGRDIALISAVLAAAAISKLTGLALIPLVYGGIGWGALRGYYGWRQVWRLAGVSLVVVAAGAGWWYARNWQLYGDPFALWQTLRIWGRGSAVSVGLSAILFEAKGVWDSFWMTLGHFNIRGPEWLYGYVPILTGLGVTGVVVALWRTTSQDHGRGAFQRQAGASLAPTSRPASRTPRPGALFDGVLLLGGTVALIVVALVAATRQINVSQGRILYPGMIGFAPLMALGWQALLGRKIAGFLIVPLAALALVTPVVYLGEAYSGLTAVAATDSGLPAGARAVNAEADGMRLLGYRLLTPVVEPGDRVALDIYIQGRHAGNPNFFVQALDPTTQATLGGVDVYPGMTPTRDLDPAVVYEASIDFRLKPDALPGDTPIRLDLAVGWRVPDVEPESESETETGAGRYLPWRDAEGRPLDLLALDGPVLRDPAAGVPDMATALTTTFGGVLRLTGVTLPDVARAGQSMPLTLAWQAAQPLNEEYTLTVGLIDAAGSLVAQQDGMPPGYPTSAWLADSPFALRWVVPIPETTAPGTYRVYVGWYTTPDITRLRAEGDRVENDVVIVGSVVVGNSS